MNEKGYVSKEVCNVYLQGVVWDVTCNAGDMSEGSRVECERERTCSKTDTRLWGSKLPREAVRQPAILPI